VTWIRQSSPRLGQASHTDTLMRWVMLATLPGLAAQTWFFGWGNLINVLWCALLAIIFESLVLRLRNRSPGPAVRDGSAALTGVLLGLSLPPLLPWWISLVAVAAAIILAKQLYGGLGQNPFNPAMTGYAVVLVAFPAAMAGNWAEPAPLLAQPPGLAATLTRIFLPSAAHIHLWADAVTMATPLSLYKEQIAAMTAGEVLKNPAFGGFIAYGWEWVNLGFLAGGILLLFRRILSWHIPASYLAALTVLSLALAWDPDTAVPLKLHLLGGATMLGAFFIATDPVTAATSRRGKLIYGAGVGALVFVIRTYGSYPDGVAFAVLLMNLCVPLIDRFTVPRPFGRASNPTGPGAGGG